MRYVQGQLWPPTVHLGSAGGACVMCAVSLPMAAVWCCCDCCPGWVAPVPAWAELTATGTPEPEPGHLAGREAA